MSRRKYMRKCMHCETTDPGRKERGVIICVVCGKPKYASRRIKEDTDVRIKQSHRHGSWGDYADMNLVCYCPDLLRQRIVEPSRQCVSGAVYQSEELCNA